MKEQKRKYICPHSTDRSSIGTVELILKILVYRLDY